MPAVKKENLFAIFRHWPTSCKQFLSEHFAENCMMYCCKIVVHELCAIFSGTPCITVFSTLDDVRLETVYITAFQDIVFVCVVGVGESEKETFGA